MDALLHDRIIAAVALQERRGDRADTEATTVELLSHRPQGLGRLVDDLHPVDRTQLDGANPKLLADIECRPETWIDLVRDHAQLHAVLVSALMEAVSELFGLEGQVAVVTGASGVLGG